MKLNFSLNTGDFDRNWTVNAVFQVDDIRKRWSCVVVTRSLCMKKETLFLHSLVNILSSCSIDSYYCLYFIYLVIYFLIRISEKETARKM